MAQQQPAQAPRRRSASTFGEYVETLMRTTGHNGLTLAAAAGVHPGTVSKLKSGVKPDSDTLRSIAVPLGVLHGDMLVEAGMSTWEELNPKPSPPLPAALRRVQERLDGRPCLPSCPRDCKRHAPLSPAARRQLLGVIDYAVQLYDQANGPIQEPNMGAGRSRPRAGRRS